MRATRFRVPDVCVTIGEPDEQIFTAPPYIVVEVLSPEDTLVRLMERVEDYETFGVPNIWIIDPAARRAWIASGGALQPAETLRADGDPPVVIDLQKTLRGERLMSYAFGPGSESR